MTAAEVAALLRIRQARERRAHAAAQAARRAEQDATKLRVGAEQIREVFALASRQRREATYDRLEGGAIGASFLWSAAAEIAGMQALGGEMDVAVGRAAAVEVKRRADAKAAAQGHSAAQRGTEALEALAVEVRSGTTAAVDRAEEAEAEEPRTRP